ncbi:hypothetical protein BDY24DRAFT_383535 [Mrakia frigida]|uniref:SGNH/GDSL hydrolase family protein n=1 Tax=Mrakia frigida TaxID=29902 RepID=UPI003FCBFA29
MRSLRSGPLPTLLGLVAAFLIGLSSNRVYVETSKAAGLINVSSSSQPSWLAGTGWGGSFGIEESGTELAEEGEELGLGDDVAGETDQTRRKRKERDDKMEEMVGVFGQAFFDKSISYSGTNHRLRRILRRALAGESISITILGGSITAGHNMPNEMGKDHTYHALFWKQWQEWFPDATHSYLPVGIGAFGSAYFANCFLEHVPAELDLVILDFAVNDLRDDDFHRSFDHLLRALLTLPSAPAVVTMEFFAIPGWIPMTTAGSNQLDSSRYLDIPSLSLRNPLLPELLLHPQRIPDFYGRLPFPDGVVDPRHPSLRGHHAAAAILKHHFWKQILHVEAHNSPEDVALEKQAVSRIGIVDEEKEGVYDPREAHTKEEYLEWNTDRTSYLEERDWGSRNEDLEVVPRMALLDPHDPSKFIPASVPQCKSLSGTREKLTILSTTKGDRIDENGVTHFGEGEGWFEWESSPEKQYIISRSPGAEVTFAITVGLGDVKLWYLKSTDFNLGIARCWIDDETALWTRFNGLWDARMSIGVIGTVREGIAPGDHLLHCVLEGPEFRISSLITG